MNWNDLYKNQPVESMPWYFRELDHDLEKALKDLKIMDGEALDLGTGPGTQAMALARLGFKVTGTDISEAAVEQAGKKAQEEKLEIQFVQDDILKSRLKGPFDFVLDRGCFHVLAKEDRSNYIQTVHKLLKPSGYFFLKTFSAKEPGSEGPYRFTPEEIENLFHPLFKVHSIHDTVFKGNRKPEPRALFSILQKR